MHPSARKTLLVARLLGAGGAILAAAPTLVHAVVNTIPATVTASDGENALPGQRVKFTSPQILQISQILPGELDGKPQVDAGADPIQGRTDNDGIWRVNLPREWLSDGGKPLNGTQFDDLQAMAFSPKSTRITFGLNAPLGDAYVMLDSGLRPWLADAVQIGDKTALTLELPGSGYSAGDVTSWLTTKYSLPQNATYVPELKPTTIRDFMTGYSGYVRNQGAGNNIFTGYPDSLKNLDDYFNSINYDPLSKLSSDWSLSNKYDWRTSSAPSDWNALANSFNQSTSLADYTAQTMPYLSIPSVGANALRSQLPTFLPQGTVGAPANYAADFANFLAFGANVASIGRDLCMTKLPARRLDGAAPEGAQESESLAAATINWDSN